MKSRIPRFAAVALLVLAFGATGTTAASASDRVSINQLYPNGCGTLCIYTDPWWAGSQINYGGNDASYPASYNNKISSFFNNTDCYVDFYSGANYTGTKTVTAPGSMNHWLGGPNDSWSSHKYRC